MARGCDLLDRVCWCVELGVKGTWFRVNYLVLWAWGSRRRVEGLGLRIELRGKGLGFRV